MLIYTYSMYVSNPCRQRAEVSDISKHFSFYSFFHCSVFMMSMQSKLHPQKPLSPPVCKTQPIGRKLKEEGLKLFDSVNECTVGFYKGLFWTSVNRETLVGSSNNIMELEMWKLTCEGCGFCLEYILHVSLPLKMNLQYKYLQWDLSLALSNVQSG